jgi:hypothetical protein
MLAVLIYVLMIALLVYWLESPVNLLPNSLKIRKCAAEELELWLKGFNWGHRNEINRPAELPHYKFYTRVIEVLLDLARRMGGNYQDSLLFLREGLQIDRQFEKKMKEIIFGTWLQMTFMMVLTWTFVVAALSLVEVKVEPHKLGMIMVWQLVGLSLLPLILKHLRKKYFSDIGNLWKMLFILRSLVNVPLSRSEILNIAEVRELKNIQQKSLAHIVEKFKSTCQRALQIGGSYEGEVLSLMEELRFQEKWHFELFEKRLMVVKLALLALFFLPSYLAFIFLLLGDLLSLM